MARLPSIVKPRQKGAGPWPAIRIVFPGDSQDLFFTLRKLAKERGLNLTEYSRRVLVDHCLRFVEESPEKRKAIFDSLLEFGQISLFEARKSAKTPMNPGKKAPKKAAKKPRK